MHKGGVSAYLEFGSQHEPTSFCPRQISYKEVYGAPASNLEQQVDREGPDAVGTHPITMDERVREFIERTALDLVGLDVALFYQANPHTFDTASGIALRTRRAVDEIEAALNRLSEHGFLEVFSRDDGRYRVYALSSAPQAWNTLCRVSEAYHDDPKARKEIILMLIQRRLKERATGGGTNA